MLNPCQSLNPCFAAFDTYGEKLFGDDALKLQSEKPRATPSSRKNKKNAKSAKRGRAANTAASKQWVLSLSHNQDALLINQQAYSQVDDVSATLTLFEYEKSVLGQQAAYCYRANFICQAETLHTEVYFDQHACLVFLQVKDTLGRALSLTVDDQKKLQNFAEFSVLPQVTVALSWAKASSDDLKPKFLEMFGKIISEFETVEKSAVGKKDQPADGYQADCYLSQLKSLIDLFAKMNSCDVFPDTALMNVLTDVREKLQAQWGSSHAKQGLFSNKCGNTQPKPNANAMDLSKKSDSQTRKKQLRELKQRIEKSYKPDDVTNISALLSDMEQILDPAQDIFYRLYAAEKRLHVEDKVRAQLLQAVKANDLQQAQRLTSLCRYPELATYFCAIQVGSLDMLQHLFLAFEVSPNIYLDIYTIRSASSSAPDLTRHVGAPLLMVAQAFERWEIAAWLLEQGGNVDFRHLLNGETMLMRAARADDVDFAAQLLAQHANPNLAKLAEVPNQMAKMVQIGMLMAHPLKRQQTPSMQKTALHDAMEQRRPVMAALLLQHGASCTGPRHFGATPYGKAVEQLKMDKPFLPVLAKLCLEYGAEVDELQGAGDVGKGTPLYFACLHNQPHIAKVLLELGADPNKIIENKFFEFWGNGIVDFLKQEKIDGKVTPFLIAVLNQHSEVISCVLKHTTIAVNQIDLLLAQGYAQRVSNQELLSILQPYLVETTTASVTMRPGLS